LQDVLLVANPISGGGRAGRLVDDVAEALRELGAAAHVVRTATAGDAKQAARDFSGGVIFAFGGDGTFNEVLNGADLERCVLGVIPAGTGNVLAKELGLTGDPICAARRLAGGRIERLDLGTCNGRRFISMVGAGMDASIVKAVHDCRRGKLTQFHYVPALVRRTVFPPEWAISVEVDGEGFLGDAGAVCVGNTHSYGGPLELTPAASPTDGLLDVMAMPLRGAGDLIGPGVASLLRSVHLCRSVRYGRGSRVRLTSVRDDVPWQADGDSGGLLPVEIQVEPGRVPMLVPGTFRPSTRIP
jgi:YegS/Rv2252/BmrU family lipid kinase